MFYINECADHEKATKIYCQKNDIDQILAMINKRQNQLNQFLNIQVVGCENRGYGTDTIIIVG